MKTVRTAILFLCVLFCTTKVAAQTFYYNHTQTFQLPGGAIWRAHLDGTGVHLYNTANQFAGKRLALRSGADIGHFLEMPFPRTAPGSDYGVFNRDFIRHIIANNLTLEEYQRVRNQPLLVRTYVNTLATNWGPPTYVSFRLHSSSPWATIPVETFQRIEEHIRQHLRYLATPHGRQLTFVRRAYTVPVENRRLQFDSQATDMNVRGLFIGGTYVRAQVEAQWGRPTRYLSSMSAETGLNESFEYIMCVGFHSNIFRFNRNGIFYAFDIRARYFPLFPAVSGGIRVGEPISRVQSIGLGTPVRQGNGHYHLVRSGFSSPIVFEVSNAGVITRIRFTDVG